MKKSAKIWLVIATSLVLIGIVTFGGAMMAMDWNFAGFSTGTYETNRYEIEESFCSVSVLSDTADIRFVATDDASCSVACYEQSNVRHTVEVRDGTLKIERVDTRKWYEYIGFSFETPTVTVYLPRGEYGSLSIRSHTGDVSVPSEFSFESIEIAQSTGSVTNEASVKKGIKISTTTGKIQLGKLSAASVELSVSTGRVSVSDVRCEGEMAIEVSTGKTTLSSVTCQSLRSKGSTGDITLRDTIVAQGLSIERSTGDVNFERCDAGEILVKTETGDVEGSLRSEKIFFVETDTGRKDVPKTTSGGRCEITTETGDVRITIS